MNPHKASALLHYIGKVKKLTWAWASRQYRHTKSGVVRLVAAHIHDKQPAPRVKRGRPGINPTAIP